MYKSSEWVTRYSVSLSRVLGMSTFVIGFILVSITTSLPEIFVTIFATLEHDANLAVGNILGSNLFDINIIIGLTTFLAGTFYMKRKETIHLIELLLILSVITLLILSLPNLSIIHGIILLTLFGYVITKLYKGGRVGKEIYEEEGQLPPTSRKRGFVNFWRKETFAPTFIKFIISVAVLLIGTKVLVDASLDIAGVLGLSTVFIGATVVAVGTSLPELSVTLAAMRKKHHALALGNIIGSAVTNLTLVLGLLAIINPAPLSAIPISGLLPFLIISTLLIWYTFSEKRKVTKYEGGILLLIYALFILEQLGLLVIFS